VPGAVPDSSAAAGLQLCRKDTIDLAEHQRVDLVTCLVEGLSGDLTDRVGAIAQVGEELIEFRLDGGVDAGEQETEDGWQGEGTAAGEVFGVEPSQLEQVLWKQILGAFTKCFLHIQAVMRFSFINNVLWPYSAAGARPTQGLTRNMLIR